MPLDHLGIYTQSSKHEETVAFYLAALEPLGYKKVMDIFKDGKCLGLGTGDAPPDFWVVDGTIGGVPEGNIAKCHFAFKSKDKETITKCYEAGIKAGGKDNGAPGLRTEYHPNYYAAFIIDPCGNNMEIVNHGM